VGCGLADVNRATRRQGGGAELLAAQPGYSPPLGPWIGEIGHRRIETEGREID
jgi:hypothetical protein